MCAANRFAHCVIMESRSARLGVLDGRLAACPSWPNCVSTQADDVQHRIEPLAFTDSPADVMQRIKLVITSLPRMKVVRETADYLHVEATSLIFRFVDDVEFYVDADARLIHFRSASRLGYSDLGANRARMKKIRVALEGR
jgi:uncharacterized protein (DUF1499 family)